MNKLTTTLLAALVLLSATPSAFALEAPANDATRIQRVMTKETRTETVTHTEERSQETRHGHSVRVQPPAGKVQLGFDGVAETGFEKWTNAAMSLFSIFKKSPAQKAKQPLLPALKEQDLPYFEISKMHGHKRTTGVTTTVTKEQTTTYPGLPMDMKPQQEDPFERMIRNFGPESLRH